MKRKPIDIVAEITNHLIKYSIDSEFSISELSKNTDSHYNTMSDYMILIQMIQRLCPQIHFDAKNKKIKIKGISPGFRKFSQEEQIILHLFSHKIFDFHSSIPISQFENQNPPQLIEKLKNLPYIQLIYLEDDPTQTRIYLKQIGMLKAQGLMASMNRLMGEYIESEGAVSLDFESQEKIEKKELELNKMHQIHSFNKNKESNATIENKCQPNYSPTNELNNVPIRNLPELTTSSSSA
jgi:hypothetical protein